MRKYLCVNILDDVSGDQQTITYLKDLYQEALTMLTHYETRYYPLSSVRQKNLFNILYELQNLPSNIGKIFFPKLHDLNNLINHINTMILQSLKIWFLTLNVPIPDKVKKLS